MSLRGRLDVPFRLAGKRLWVAGHRGLVGQALVRRLEREECELVTVGRGELDLRRQADTEAWLDANRPQVVFLAAALVGGIHANNTRPAEFIYDNLAIATNVIHGAWRCGVSKLVALGSSCIYPREAAQPLVEESLLTGPLEPTNEWYAVAKIAALKLCQAYRRQYGADFISAMPTNLYGPGDRFDPQSSHVVPALLQKIHAAHVRNEPAVSIWGTGKPRRELMYVDDCADALVHLAAHYSGEDPVNVGTGVDVTIRELAELIAGIVGYRGGFEFDTSRPDGTPQKKLDVSRLSELGWRARTDLETGLRQSYACYLSEWCSPAVRPGEGGG
jgi:GDP-L-fucose synthase